MGHQVGDGRFAVRAGDPNPGGGLAGLPGRADLAVGGDPLVAQPVQGGVVPADARTDDHPFAGRQERLETVRRQGLAQFNGDALGTQPLGFALMLRPLAALQDENVDALLGQEPGGTQSRSAQPENHGHWHGLKLD